MLQLFNSPDSLLASFVSGTEPGRLLLVTGSSGSGKSSWCLSLAGYASTLGLGVSGLVSPPIFVDNHKVGINLLDLKSGLQRRLAVRRRKVASNPNTEDWQFDDLTLRWGNTILEKLDYCQLLILDELGPLEFQRGIGFTAGIELVSTRHYQLACVVIRPSLLDQAQALWPWGQVYRLPIERVAESQP